MEREFFLVRSTTGRVYNEAESFVRISRLMIIVGTDHHIPFLKV